MKNKLFYVVLASAGLTWLGCKKESDKPQTIPTLTTTPVSGITKNEAVLGGTVTDNGNLDVQERGVCYSDTTAAPTYYNWKTSDGTGNGAFTSSLSNLEPNTTYYARAYARNSKGVGYGTTVTFATNPTGPIPTLDLPVISNITGNDAFGSATITSDAGFPVQERGICWSINKIPTIKDSKTKKVFSALTYLDTLTGLTYSTTYTVRAYATNANGTGYSSEISFKTPAGLPRLTTEPVSGVTQGTATFSGTMTFNGNTAVTQRGFVWDTLSTVSLGGTGWSQAIPGTDYLKYTFIATNLFNNKTYYVRSYATNISGTAYGNIQSFKIQVPECRTKPDSIKARPTYLIVSGDTLKSYGEAILETGFVYSKNLMPVLDLVKPNYVKAPLGPTGFTAKITSLDVNTVYHVRAYATHSKGTGYGEDVIFKTPPAFIFGKDLEGGKVLYVYPDKSRGLIISGEDMLLNATDSTWGCEGISIPTLDSIGSGLPNTNKILGECGASGTAARLSKDYVYNGYSDWYLPSMMELKEFFTRKSQIGMAATDSSYYWSSSQESAANAYLMKLSNGSFVPEPKSTGTKPKKIRAVRFFE